MARLQRKDRALKVEMDELEMKMFRLKIVYEKYFNGLEKLEPSRDREDLRRQLRAMGRKHFSTTAQRYRYQTLKARFTSLDQYLTRNLVLIERGTHPKFRFRADLAESARRGQRGPSVRTISPLEARRLREEEAYHQVYDKYIEARRECGLGTNIEIKPLKQVLSKQVRTIKNRYDCQSVRFRIAVQDGAVRLKAVPMMARKKQSDDGSGS